MPITIIYNMRNLIVIHASLKDISSAEEYVGIGNLNGDLLKCFRVTCASIISFKFVINGWFA